MPVALLALLAAATAPVADFSPGDVFVALRGGVYDRYSASGDFRERLLTFHPNLGTGCAFDAAGDLYVTQIFENRVVKLSAAHPHPVLFDIHDVGPAATGPDGRAESIVFDRSGSFLVGRGLDRPDAGVHRYDAAGNLLGEYLVPVEAEGSDWLDLAADQCTLYYTSEGRRILRYDVCSGRPLADFASFTDPGTLFALRLLPPGDGSGGLVVANQLDIRRLDAAGQVVMTYDAPREDGWFALNLTPDGTAFWSGNPDTGRIYRFHLGSGTIEAGPFQVAATGDLWGVCVYAEPTAATCIERPAVVTGLRAWRQDADLRLAWDPARDAATQHYNVWKVIDGDKALIPAASIDEARFDPAIAAACRTLPRPQPSCTDRGAIPLPPPLLFYQVRGACEVGAEGTEHPY